MTAPTATRETSYERVIRLINAKVAEVNALLGYSTVLDADCRRTCVEFGYIGNCSLTGGSYDDRSWMVFLPHPGRVGTYEDQIGGFRTNDVEGARHCLVQLAAFAKGVRFVKVGA